MRYIHTGIITMLRCMDLRWSSSVRENCAARRGWGLGSEVESVIIGHSPASNGTIVVKNNFRNVPERAVNLSALQNPGSGRTVQFFFKGGLNDAGY